MGILEIIGIGYLVNILGLLLIITMSILEFYIRFYMNKVDAMKGLLVLQAATKKFEDTKQACRNLKISPFIGRESHILFPFATLIVFVISFIKFLQLSLVDYIFYKVSRNTEELENRIKDHENNEKL